ncbi:MAG: hypothetical protein ACYTG7_24730, partial [Planctomycetota bacterium]
MRRNGPRPWPPGCRRRDFRSQGLDEAIGPDEPGCRARGLTRPSRKGVTLPQEIKAHDPPSTFGTIFGYALPLLAAVLLLGLSILPEAPVAPQLPRGDVAIDAAVAESLADGKGFWTPWERGSLYRPVEEVDAFGFPADQHPPLWPLLGALIIRVIDTTPLRALEWASFAAHL